MHLNLRIIHRLGFPISRDWFAADNGNDAGDDDDDDGDDDNDDDDDDDDYDNNDFPSLVCWSP